MVLYFIGVYMINRTLHGRLEIPNFSSCVEKNISLVHCAHSLIFQHSKEISYLCAAMLYPLYINLSNITQSYPSLRSCEKMTCSVKFQSTAFIILFDSFPKVKINLGSQVPEKNSFASFFYFGGNIIRP